MAGENVGAGHVEIAYAGQTHRRIRKDPVKQIFTMGTYAIVKIGLDSAKVYCACLSAALRSAQRHCLKPASPSCGALSVTVLTKHPQAVRW